MRNLILIAVSLLITSCASTNSTSNNTRSGSSFNQFDYDVTCEFVGKEGTQAIVVSTIRKTPEEALSAARMQAVHAIIYKGINSDQCKVPPLVVRDVYLRHKNYFDSFFQSGAFLQYVVSASDAPVDLFYVGKLVKVSSDVSVDRNQLREMLVNDDILQNLGDIF